MPHTSASAPDPQCPLPEYPRPQLRRASYHCLNGRWQYAITHQDTPPTQWDGDILVPYSPESPLSGVRRQLQPDEFLWYRLRFLLPDGFVNQRLLLHFGAVDQYCTVYWNGAEVGRHSGGYTPFCFDVTTQLADGEQEIWVMACDESETAPYPRGRQRRQAGGLWHPAQSGIWQTVWLESVPDAYIQSLRITPDYDQSAVELLVAASTAGEGTVEIYARNTLAATGRFTAGQALRLALPGALSWSVGRPFLYTLKLSFDGDKVESYFAMRKIALQKDSQGRLRLSLNNRPFFAAGVLDLGLHGDGLYTPPSDAAMENDIRLAKDCGFTLIRKQDKIEPLRWYHHCDRLGMLVWQDLPFAAEEATPGLWKRLFSRRGQGFLHLAKVGEDGRQAVWQEAQAAATLLHNSPCLCIWGLCRPNADEQAVLTKKLQMLQPQRLVYTPPDALPPNGDEDFPSWHQAACGLPGAALPEGMPPGFWAVGGFALGSTAGTDEEAGADTAIATEVCPTPQAMAEALRALYQDHLLPFAQQGGWGFVYYQLADAGDERTGLTEATTRRPKLQPKGLHRLNALLQDAVPR